MYRPLNDYERMLIGHILSQEFPGREILERQISNAMVKVDNDGYVLPFAPDPGFVGTPFKQSVPLETFYPDVDGITVHALLGVTKEGQLVSLEFYRDDGGTILSRASSDTLKLY